MGAGVVVVVDDSDDSDDGDDGALLLLLLLLSPAPQNRNQLQLREGVSLKEAHAAEMEFFRSHSVFKTVRSCFS